ncbi:SDR family NAD(P)-dependent oxidoreductase [Microbacterium sp. NPDC056044]|uniref:SDR family NAD(P)-dependent oxidoreductase n=1 Tax=Microbacterium sp. NPDC056044 TaxID=3345690 RepID=UPI0035DB3F84
MESSPLAPARLFSCAGQVAVVTGAATGIGRAAAEALAAAGARVVLAGLTSFEPERAAADLVGQGADAIGVAWDVTDAAALSDLVEAVARRFGRLDTVVASVGAAFDDPGADARIHLVKTEPWAVPEDPLEVVHERPPASARQLSWTRRANQL